MVTFCSHRPSQPSGFNSKSQELNHVVLPVKLPADADRETATPYTCPTRR